MKKIFFLLLLFSVSLYSQTWTQQQLPIAPGNIQTIYAVNNNVCWASGLSNTCLRTTNGGINWYDVHGNFNQSAYSIFGLDENHALLGADDGTIWYTTNGGNSWNFSIPSPPTIFIDGIYMFNSLTGFAIGDPTNQQWKFYITTNGGVSWTLSLNTPTAGSSTEAGWNNAFCALDTGHIWWCTNNSKIYKGSLRGPFTASVTPALNQFGMAMQSINNGIAICNNSSNSVQNERTTTGGLNWFSMSYTPTGLTYGIKCAPTTGSYEYWIVGAGILYSIDNGITWSSQLSGVNFSCISMVNVQCGWAGGAGVVYKYSSTHPVGISIDPSVIPKTFSVSQNYPNPFNPTTTIDFSLPKSSNVNFKIYDVLGNEVMTVVNEFKPAGNYSINVDASKLSSGIYFYKMQAADFKDTKKMMVIK